MNARSAVDEPVVAELMSAPAGTVPVSAPLRNTAAAMRELDLADVSVVDGDGMLHAVVSEHDLVVAGLAAGLGPDDPIGAVHCDPPLTVSPDTPAGATLDLMLAHHLSELPVTSRGRLLGRVTMAAVTQPLAVAGRGAPGRRHGSGRCLTRTHRSTHR
jgi:CBS domain-containing protein